MREGESEEDKELVMVLGIPRRGAVFERGICWRYPRRVFLAPDIYLRIPIIYDCEQARNMESPLTL